MLYLLIDALLVPLFNSVLVLVLVACSSSPFLEKERGGIRIMQRFGIKTYDECVFLLKQLFRFINGSASHHVWDSVWANP